MLAPVFINQAAIFDFSISSLVANYSHESLWNARSRKHIGLAIGLSSNSSLGPEILAFDVLWPPSWILHFWLIPTVFPSIPMESRTQNLGDTVGLPLMSRL